MGTTETINCIPKKAREMHGLISQIRKGMKRNITFPVFIDGETRIHEGAYLSSSEMVAMLINEANQEYLEKDENLKKRIDIIVEDPSAVIYGITKQGRSQTDEAVCLLKRMYSLKIREIKANFYNDGLRENEFIRQITPVIGVQLCLENLS
ncbi:MAG: hypothetical protein COY68_02185 [Candidatus Levybacteria bacterium CG_4_10_14_0_8_um_filter_35_23]|nr:MAG: hypothetical protein COY68_02185 [Candidatus Levybacteria bacterium CG_4_10_14_0_8_um_filter_35_23]